MKDMARCFSNDGELAQCRNVEASNFFFRGIEEKNRVESLEEVSERRSW